MLDWSRLESCTCPRCGAAEQLAVKLRHGVVRDYEMTLPCVCGTGPRAVAAACGRSQITRLQEVGRTDADGRLRRTGRASEAQAPSAHWWRILCSRCAPGELGDAAGAMERVVAERVQPATLGMSCGRCGWEGCLRWDERAQCWREVPAPGATMGSPQPIRWVYRCPFCALAGEPGLVGIHTDLLLARRTEGPTPQPIDLRDDRQRLVAFGQDAARNKPCRHAVNVSFEAIVHQGEGDGDSRGTCHYQGGWRHPWFEHHDRDCAVLDEIWQSVPDDDGRLPTPTDFEHVEAGWGESTGVHVDVDVSFLMAQEPKALFTALARTHA